MTICSQYGSINCHIFLLGKSYTSAPHVKLQEREKVIKNLYISGYAVSLSLTCVYTLQVHNTCVLVRSVYKAMGAYSCKGQKAQVSLPKSYLWSFLEHSRSLFDVYGAPPDGSCIPTKEGLIPSRGELSHPKRGLSH